MTNQQHPITPPPELFKQWKDDILNERDNVDHVLDCAWRNGFQAGADQELEACCEWLTANGNPRWGVVLQKARRPKPPSLAEQAKAELHSHLEELRVYGMGFCSPAISAALERLQELENNG